MVVVELYLQIKIKIIKVITRTITTRIRMVATIIAMVAVMAEVVALAGVAPVVMPIPSLTGAVMALVTKIPS